MKTIQNITGIENKALNIIITGVVLFIAVCIIAVVLKVADANTVYSYNAMIK